MHTVDGGDKRGPYDFTGQRIQFANALFCELKNMHTVDGGENKFCANRSWTRILFASAFFSKLESKHTVDGGEKNKYANRTWKLPVDGTEDPSVRVCVACGNKTGFASVTTRKLTTPSVSLKTTSEKTWVSPVC